MSNKSVMCVALKYKLEVPLSGGAYDKSGQKKQLHGPKIISRQYVEDRNSHPNNEIYIIDEEATDLYLLEMEENKKKNAIKKSKEKLGMNDLIDAIATSPKKENKLPKGIPNEDWSLKELKLYCDENNIEYHHASKSPKILTLINENK